MDEQQLFTGAPEAFILSAHWVPGEGWTARLRIRRQYEAWESTGEESYDHLTTSELATALEAMSASLWSGLGL